MAEDEYKARVLYFLMKRRQWGGKHSEETELERKFDPRIRSQLMQAKEELIKQGWIISSPKTKERHLYLNPRYTKEICDLVEKWFDISYLITFKKKKEKDDQMPIKIIATAFGLAAILGAGAVTSDSAKQCLGYILARCSTSFYNWKNAVIKQKELVKKIISE